MLVVMTMPTFSRPRTDCSLLSLCRWPTILHPIFGTHIAMKIFQCKANTMCTHAAGILTRLGEGWARRARRRRREHQS